MICKPILVWQLGMLYLFTVVNVASASQVQDENLHQFLKRSYDRGSNINLASMDGLYIGRCVQSADHMTALPTELNVSQNEFSRWSIVSRLRTDKKLASVHYGPREFATFSDETLKAVPIAQWQNQFDRAGASLTIIEESNAVHSFGQRYEGVLYSRQIASGQASGEWKCNYHLDFSRSERLGILSKIITRCSLENAPTPVVLTGELFCHYEQKNILTRSEIAERAGSENAARVVNRRPIRGQSQSSGHQGAFNHSPSHHLPPLSPLPQIPRPSRWDSW